MSAKNNKVANSNENQNANQAQAVDKSKRSFSKMGAVAPVIMTLASRSALGGPTGAQLCTVSGYISATPTNISGRNHHVTWCGGLTPGAYATPYDGAGVWTSTLWTPGGPNKKIKGGEGFGKRPNPIGTKMFAAFGYSGLLASNTMYDVLWMDGTQDQDPFQLSGHLVAALLNAQSELYVAQGGLTVGDVRAMYEDLSINGTYTAAPGVVWSKAQVVTFLKQTMD